MPGERLRAYKVVLDPTREQERLLAGSAGAARAAFNHALGVKVRAHRAWLQEVAFATYEQGLTEQEARKQIKCVIPSSMQIQKRWIRLRGDWRTCTPGYMPWWAQYSSRVYTAAFRHADAAWSNWLKSLGTTRRVGYPRFKKRREGIGSFQMHHDVKNPQIRPDGYRRLHLPRIGSVRLMGNLREMARKIARGTAVVQSVTVSHRGHRWYASVLVKETYTTPSRRTRHPRVVGVDLGVHHLAALSTGEFIENPRYLKRSMGRLTRLQRRLSRAQRGSNHHSQLRAELARAHHLVALQRTGHLNQLTKRLTTKWERVAIEDLNVAGMTRRPHPKPDPHQPGAWLPNGGRAKAGLNRSILDASPAEIRRQLAYKSTWYGSHLVVVDRWYPSSQIHHACGRRNPNLQLRDRVITCECGAPPIDRDTNAAINLARYAHEHVGPDTGQTQNGVETNHLNGGRSMKRQDRPPLGAGHPGQSNLTGVPKPIKNTGTAP